MHGANVISVRGNFDKALEMVQELCISHGLYLLNSINPFRLEGQKTIGFEVIDQLGGVPDRIVLPVGNAGNISAVHKGLGELRTLGLIDRLPMMTGIQAEGLKPCCPGDTRGAPGSGTRETARDRGHRDSYRGTGKRREGTHRNPANRRNRRMGYR